LVLCELFVTGQYCNTLSALVDLNGLTDKTFGFTGLNAFVDQVTSREQAAAR